MLRAKFRPMRPRVRRLNDTRYTTDRALFARIARLRSSEVRLTAERGMLREMVANLSLRVEMLTRENLRLAWRAR